MGKTVAGRPGARDSRRKGLERSRRNMGRNWTETAFERGTRRWKFGDGKEKASSSS